KGFFRWWLPPWGRFFFFWPFLERGFFGWQMTCPPPPPRQANNIIFFIVILFLCGIFSPAAKNPRRQPKAAPDNERKNNACDGGVAIRLPTTYHRE
ncbi:MAG: hypothetical protein ACR2NY_01490, partial [Alphaproteobacteria bacterium]